MNTSSARLVELQENVIGGNGGVAIVGTSATASGTGKVFYAISALTETVVAAATTNTGFTSPGITTLAALPAGSIVYGQWTSITLTSGECVCYYANV